MEKGQLSTLGVASRNALSPSGGSANCSPELASILATRLFGFYRASEANDPETFITGATAVLSRYPQALVYAVCDPVSGLPGEDAWLPSIARIRVECERRMQPLRDQERRDRVRGETLGRRTAGKAPIGSREHQRVVEGYQAVAATLDPTPVAVAPLDARTAPTPELRAQAVAYHEARLQELAGAYAAGDRLAREPRGDGDASP